MVAAGESIHMMRPGGVQLATHEAPEDHAPHAIAVEPWAPHRYAIASPGLLSVYSGWPTDELLMELSFGEEAGHPMHLAWTRHGTGGKPAIYFADRRGKLGRVLPDEERFETLNAPRVDAMAYDEDGVVALYTWSDDAPEILVSQENGEWGVRIVCSFGEDDGEEPPRIWMAIGGGRVAYTRDHSLVEVSDHDDEDFKLVDGFYGGGELAIAPDGTLFISQQRDEDHAEIYRVTRADEVTRIAEITRDPPMGPLPEPEDPDIMVPLPQVITGMAWDATRRALFVAAPELGLLAVKEPGEKGKKRILLS
jgi:hypothetical protein